MVDVLTRPQRSLNMSRIRSRWTSPERSAHNMLKGWKVCHRMHPNIYGRPDILLVKTGVLVFIDGCFWHGCPVCYSLPATNKSYWREKVRRNRQRDREVNRILRSWNWRFIRVWEHKFKKNRWKTIRRILDDAGSRSTRRINDLQ